MPKLKSLEMLRALAAILVVLFHTQYIFGTRAGIIPFWGMFSSGSRGVDLFFVLSGFIISRSHDSDIGRPYRLGNFIFNRAARIYPAVWIMTTFAGGLYAMGFGGFDKTSKLTEWGVVASALLLPQVGARAGSALVNVTWTLKYEIFFYLLFSMRILNSKFGAALLISWQIAIVTFNLLNRSGTLELSSFYLSSLCLEFGVGICCAWLIGRPEFNNLFNRREIQWTVLAAGIAMFIGGMLVEKNIDSAGILCAFGAGATIIALIFLEQAAQISIPNFIVFLGSASYAIYLVHYSIITIFAIIITHIHILPLNNFVFIVAATIGVSVGICFDQLIDKPIQRLLQQKLKPILLNIHRNG